MSPWAVHRAVFHQWLAALAMVAASLAAWWLTPHERWYEHIGRPVFEEIVPRQFGDWVQDDSASAGQIVDPQLQTALESVYTQTVSRIYLNKSNGRRIMLSLAYGENQSYAHQLHRPEACYSSQGATIEELHEESISVNGRVIPVYRMKAAFGMRKEQVTYLIRIGDEVISGPPSALNKARTRLGFKGYVADGLLFRVSEIADDPQDSNPLQDRFIQDLVSALPASQQGLLIGESSAGQPK
jgi:EpsI family protein